MRPASDCFDATSAKPPQRTAEGGSGCSLCYRLTAHRLTAVGWLPTAGLRAGDARALLLRSFIREGPPRRKKKGRPPTCPSNCPSLHALSPFVGLRTKKSRGLPEYRPPVPSCWPVRPHAMMVRPRTAPVPLCPKYNRRTSACGGASRDQPLMLDSSTTPIRRHATLAAKG